MAKKKRSLESFFIQSDITEKNIKKRTMRKLITKYAQTQRNLRIFDWAVLEISKRITQNHFEVLKSYAQRQRLKKNAPRIYEINLLQRALLRVKSYQLRQQKNRAIGQLIVSQTQLNTISRFTQVWRFRLFQKVTLRKRLATHQLMRLRKILGALRDESEYQKEKRQVFQAQLSILDQFRKKKALQKLVTVT